MEKCESISRSNRSNTTRSSNIDLVELIIKNAIPTTAREIGHSIFLRLPKDIAKELQIKDGNTVKILILEVIEKIDDNDSKKRKDKKSKGEA